MVLAHFRFSS